MHSTESIGIKKSKLCIGYTASEINIRIKIDQILSLKRLTFEHWKENISTYRNRKKIILNIITFINYVLMI